MEYVTCSKCDGDGELKCPKCGGSSFAHSVKATTSEMFGIKEDEQCTRCHDNFVVQCNACGGTGKVSIDEVEEKDEDYYDDEAYDSSSDENSNSSDSGSSLFKTRPQLKYSILYLICSLIFLGMCLYDYNQSSNSIYRFFCMFGMLISGVFILMSIGGIILNYKKDY